MVTGMVRKIKTGLINAFTNPIKSAVIMAVKKFFTETPFNMYAVIKTAKALMMSLSRKLSITIMFGNKDNY